MNIKGLFTALFSGLLAACSAAPPPGVEPVRGFDAARYMGVWYEIMRLDHSFERGLTKVTATYALREDGRVSVLNRGFDPARCDWREADGVASRAARWIARR
jgi:apolipoprotein D and lipocalin family protein